MAKKMKASPRKKVIRYTEEEHALLALSPLDGRYAEKMKRMAKHFSEFALMKYRLCIEVLYLIMFCEKVKIPFSDKHKRFALALVDNFSLKDAKRIKEIEMGTKNSAGEVVKKGINHDLKSVEVFLREKLKKAGAPNKVLSAIHFGLTSADVDNIARSWMFANAFEEVVNSIEKVHKSLAHIVEAHERTPFLARTHGQPAIPTTFGKEMNVFRMRVSRYIRKMYGTHISVKFGGAVGNLNAHYVAYPEINWQQFSDDFVERISSKLIDTKCALYRNSVTTQIDDYDSTCDTFSKIAAVNTLLIGFARDAWEYISDDLVVQKAIKEEVGSSAMPQKVNPIDFENAEGNLGLANALLLHFTQKLPISRRQRDLTDSTVIRNVGIALGHSLLAYQAILKGLSKISPNVEKMRLELEAHPEVVAEGLQTILRREGIPDAYNMLKDISRGKKLTKEMMFDFIQALSVKDSVKDELLAITPVTYIGDAVALAKK